MTRFQEIHAVLTGSQAPSNQGTFASIRAENLERALALLEELQADRRALAERVREACFAQAREHGAFAVREVDLTHLLEGKT